MANQTWSKLRRIGEQAHAFFHEKDIERQTHQQSYWLRAAHFWLLVGKSFIKNRCPVRASALAYTTLLALVPLLAVGASIATAVLQQKGEEPVRQLVTHLVENVAPTLGLDTKVGDVEAVNRRQVVVTNITTFIARIQSGTLGITGTIALIFVAIGLLRTIEATFNDIWGVTHGRGIISSIIRYWATITMGPILFIIVLGLFTAPRFTHATQLVENWPFIGAVLFKVIPITLVSVGFAVFYLLMPNTSVQPLAALAGGAVGGTLWYVNNKMAAFYASKAVTYSAIYGSLGILPLFLVGMYLSWLILLFGAQVAYAFQNRQAYLQEKQAESVNHRGREFVALRIMTRIAQRFQRGQTSPNMCELASDLGVPSRLIGQVLQALLHARLVVEVLGGETGYAPARPIRQITAHDIVMALRTGKGQELETHDDGTRQSVRLKFEAIYDAEREIAASMNLESLANESPVIPVVTKSQGTL